MLADTTSTKIGGRLVRRRIASSWRLCALLIVLSGAASAAAPGAAGEDRRVSWLRENVLAVRSIAAGDLDFSDLRPLGAILGNARVVMLGEISHGDGSAFAAKVRLIEYLHRELGFSVLAFESGLYDCAKAWDLMGQGEDPGRAARRGVFGIWSGSEQAAPLWKYLGEQVRGPRPLELAGIDNQFTASAAEDFLLGDLERFLAGSGSRVWLGTAGWKAVRDGLAKLIADAEPKPPEAAVRQRFQHGIADLAHEIRRHGASPDSSFWLRVVDDARVLALMDWESDNARASRLRDEQMAANLVWLARERRPQAKIVVWAATRHILGDLRGIELAGAGARQAYPGGAAMGAAARHALGDAVFALGFLAADGAAGRLWEAPRALAAPPEGSLEDLLRCSGYALAVVDLRRPGAGGDWLREPLVARPLGYVPMRADWSRSLDGFFFIRTMTPSTRAAPPPSGGSVP